MRQSLYFIFIDSIDKNCGLVQIYRSIFGIDPGVKYLINSASTVFYIPAIVNWDIQRVWFHKFKYYYPRVLIIILLVYSVFYIVILLYQWALFFKSSDIVFRWYVQGVSLVLSLMLVGFVIFIISDIRRTY